MTPSPATPSSANLINSIVTGDKLALAGAPSTSSLLSSTASLLNAAPLSSTSLSLGLSYPLLAGPSPSASGHHHLQHHHHHLSSSGSSSSSSSSGGGGSSSSSSNNNHHNHLNNNNNLNNNHHNNNQHLHHHHLHHQLHHLPPPHRHPIGTNPHDVNNPLSVNQLTGQCSSNKDKSAPKAQDSNSHAIVSVT